MEKNDPGLRFFLKWKNKDQIFHLLNMLIPVLMGIYILVTPLPLSSINEICFYLSCSILLVLLIFKKTDFTLHTPVTLPFALFLFWVVLGLFFALDIGNSIHDVRSHLLKYFMIFYLLVNYFSTDKRLEILSLLVIAGATLFSIGGMIGFYIVEGHPLSERMGFTFRHMQTTYLGFITVFAAILAVRSFHHYNYFTYKVLFGICFLINVLVTILTQCRGFLISLAVMMIILCFDNKKNAILIIVALLLLLAVPGSLERAKQMGFTEDIRGKMYRLSWEIIKDYPIAGIGFGMETYSNKKLISLDKYNKRLPPEHQQKTFIVETPHGTFFDIAVRTGLVGFVLFFYILLTPIWLLWKILRIHKDDRFRSWAIYLLAGLITFGVESAFYDATYGERAIYFYTILAMITISWNLSRKTAQSTAIE